MNDETTLSEVEAEDENGNEMTADEPEQPEVDEEAEEGAENVVRFPGNATEHAQLMRMVEALLFAAAEPLDIDSIAGRLPEGADVGAVIEDLQKLSSFVPVCAEISSDRYHSLIDRTRV